MPRTAQRPSGPERLLELLWSPDARVGRSGLTLETVVEQAIGLADAEGLGALSMRSLAERAGVGAMTLYGYVPGRDELIELMVDAVVARTYDGADLPGSLPDWASAIRHIAHRNYAHALTHGWLGDVPPSRPILGPGHLRKYELELAPLDRIGLDDVSMDQALTHVLATASHAARWQTSVARARRESTLDDEQWWQRVSPHLDAALGGMPLPISSRVGTSVGDAGDPSRFLTRAVDAVIADVRTRVAHGAPRHGGPGP